MMNGEVVVRSMLTDLVSIIIYSLYLTGELPCPVTTCDIHFMRTLLYMSEKWIGFTGRFHHPL